MNALILLLALTLPVAMQTPVSNASGENATSATDQAKAIHHKNAVALVELLDLQQPLSAKIKESIEGEAKAAILKACSTCLPAFADEWSKRMLARIEINKLIDVYVQVYEKYFTNEEIIELISLQKAFKASQNVSPSPELQAKITSAMPSVMSDTMAEMGRITGKLGAEIGMEIGTEHPEYVGEPVEPKSH